MTENSHLEYLECAIEVGCYYSVAVPAFGPHGPAAEAVVDGIVCFNVLDRHGKRSRLVLVPTFDSEDEVALRAPLAFLVQYFGVWRSDPGRGVIVCAGSDPQWLPYERLGASITSKLHCSSGSAEQATPVVASIGRCDPREADRASFGRSVPFSDYRFGFG